MSRILDPMALWGRALTSHETDALINTAYQAHQALVQAKQALEQRQLDIHLANIAWKARKTGEYQRNDEAIDAIDAVLEKTGGPL